jgi:large subunit ribosomal protein L31
VFSIRKGRLRAFRDVAWIPRGEKRLKREITMKEKIHPKYVETKVTCGCGNTFMTRSTKPELKVDICNACHPFYTGRLKFVDSAGRIEKFRNKFAGNYGKKKA